MEEENNGMGWGLRVCFLLFVAAGVWGMHRYIAGSHSSGPSAAPEIGGAADQSGSFMQLGKTIMARRISRKGKGALRDADGGGSLSGPAAYGGQAGDEGRDADVSAVRPRSQGPAGFSYETFAEELRKASNDPEKMRAILDDETVVRNYMALPQVQAALDSKASLAAYLKDPKNTKDWISDRDVTATYGDSRMFGAVASSRLVETILSHPSALDLLRDRAAVTNVMASNHPLAAFFSDPRVISLLMQNPKTAAAMAR